VKIGVQVLFVLVCSCIRWLDQPCEGRIGGAGGGSAMRAPDWRCPRWIEGAIDLDVPAADLRCKWRIWGASGGLVVQAADRRCKHSSEAMAPRLQLPDNFRVRMFGSSRNNNGIGRYLMPPARNDAASVIPTPGVVHVVGADEITHLSETRLS
jgi:hypothetical protein